MDEAWRIDSSRRSRVSHGRLNYNSAALRAGFGVPLLLSLNLLNGERA